MKVYGAVTETLNRLAVDPALGLVGSETSVSSNT